MINFVVVEDNARHRKRIKEIILRYMMKKSEEFDIYEYEKETKELEEVIERKEEDHVYILDFILPNTNAINISRKIREKDWSSPIIIFTVNGGMAYETFKQRLQILDFVNKQYEAEKNLKELFEICMNQFKIKESLKLKHKGVKYNIDTDKIKYIYRDTLERKCVIVTNNSEYRIAINISEIKEKLKKNFMYTEKGCIVNMERVEVIVWKDKKIEFDDGSKIYMLSKKHKKEIMEYAK